METENKDWKPEVGKTAWYNYHDGSKGNEIREVMVDREENVLGSISFSVYSKKYGMSWDYVGLGEIFPTPEAALASIKIYDLEGKEVVIPRARPIFDGKHLHRFLRDEAGQHEPWIDKLKKGWEVFEAYKASKGAQKPWDEVESRALRIMFTDEAGMLNYSWEQCLAMARREIGAGAAIGGKSDQREGGC